MVRGKKFQKLHDFFSFSEEKRITLSFKDIENIIGQDLAPSARKHQAYWSGPSSHPFPRSWAYHDYKLEELSLNKGYAVFTRNEVREGKYRKKIDNSKVRVKDADVKKKRTVESDKWIISANSKIYNHQKAFEKWGYIDWKQGNYTYEVGETVYIYATYPYQTITHKTKVVKTKLKAQEIVDDSQYWNSISDYKKSLKGDYVRLELAEILSNEYLNLDKLLDHGLKSAPQGPQRLSRELYHYIKGVTLVADAIIYPDSVEDGEMYEGGIRAVTLNRFERNPVARLKCIEYHGLNCKICNTNFQEVYGKLGGGFIHVHHIFPISSIDEKYSVDPVHDLIPVCPNCHAMLHKKNNQGRCYTVEELKIIIDKKKNS